MSARPWPPRLRQWHATLAPLALLPLLVTVATGVGYRLARDWAHLNRDQAHLLMAIHEGEWLKRWLGEPAETLYVLANGLGLLWMLGTGAALLLERWRRRPPAKAPAKPAASLDT